MSDDVYTVQTRYCIAVDGHLVDMTTISTDLLVNELTSRDETTVYEVEEGQQCSIAIGYKDVDYTTRMPAAWILEVLK